MQELQSRDNYPLSKYAIIFFCLTRVVALLFSFPCVTDIFYYFDYYTKIHQDLLPYRDFSFEYPPLSLIPILLPEFLLNPNSGSAYHVAFASIMLSCDALCLRISRTYCRKQLQMDEKRILYMTVVYSVFGLLLFRIIYHRLDMVVGLSFVISLMLFESRSSKLKWQFFANEFFGFFYKIIPIITLPPAMIFKIFSGHSIKKILQSSLIFFLLLLLTILMIENYTNHNFLKNMMVHAKRGIQIESSYASLILFINLLLNHISPISNSYGSWNIAVSTSLDLVAKFLGNLLLLLFYGALFFTLNRKNKVEISEESFLDATLISILLFLAFQRVLSTQFFIWLMPIAAIWLAKKSSLKFLLIFSFLFFATFAIFSIDYLAMVNGEPTLVTILFLRNLLLIAVTAFLIKDFFKKLCD